MQKSDLNMRNAIGLFIAFLGTASLGIYWYQLLQSPGPIGWVRGDVLDAGPVIGELTVIKMAYEGGHQICRYQVGRYPDISMVCVAERATLMVSQGVSLIDHLDLPAEVGCPTV